MENLKRKEISTTRMQIIRDVFVFACYTGMGYAELSNLSSTHNHQGDDGEKWIITDRTKTEIRCWVPLLPQANIILQKYKDFPVNRNIGKLLPVHSNQKMNSYLKELAGICGITKNLSMHVARYPNVWIC